MTELSGLNEVLGAEFRDVTPDRVVATWTTGPQHLQPFGIVHGGCYCAVHEAAASVAGQVWIGEGSTVVGVNNSTDFLRQAGAGEVMTTTATPVHRGRSQQVWRLETHNQDGKLMAQGQVRLANLNRPLPSGTLDRFTAARPEP